MAYNPQLGYDPDLMVKGDISKTPVGGTVNLSTGSYERVATPTGEYKFQLVQPRESRVQGGASFSMDDWLSRERAANTPNREDELRRYLTDPGAAPDKEQIRQNKLRQAQANADLIRAQFANVIESAREEGKAGEARVRASNVSAGLAGSDFASTAAAGAESRTRKLVGSYEAERDARINAILSEVDFESEKEFQAQRQQYRGEAESALRNIETFRTQQKAKAIDMIGGLVSNGASFNKFESLDPDRLDKLRKLGLSDEELKGIWVNKIFETAKDRIIPGQSMKVENGKISIMMFTPDGTGVQSQTFDVGEQFNGGKLWGTNPHGQMVFGPEKIDLDIPLDQQMKVYGARKDETPPGENPQLYSGLSGPTATAVRSRVSAFKSEPIVQNFATIQEGRNFATSISDTTKNPADDQALIYSLAKALDPGSVVREGEYATAQKYAQSWVKAYGKGVEQALLGTGFLSQEARSNIKKTIEQKYGASLKSYENIYNQYKSGIENLTGGTNGDKFLTDYRIPTTTNEPTAPTGEQPVDFSTMTDEELNAYIRDHGGDE